MPIAPDVISMSQLINPTERQKDFLRAMRSHRFTLYGGAGGSGKSYILRWALLAFLMEAGSKGFKGVQAVMMCETYPSLKDRQIKRVRAEFPDWIGKYHEQDNEFRLSKEWGGGVLMFRNLDDASKYQSTEFAAIAVDELTKNHEQTFHDLLYRLRWPGLEDTRFIAATNPGGIGHAWVKKLWIDRDFSDTDFDPEDFAFIPARESDNPFNPKSYKQRLDQLPENMRKALRDGSWDLYEGMFFPEFSPAKHVVDEVYLDPNWERGVAVDWGFAEPWVALWGARDPATGRIYIYRELYERQVPDSEQARRILVSGALERRDFAVADPAMWSKRGANNPCVADIYRDAGLSITPASNDRVSGWQIMREAMGPMSDGKPGLQITRNCANLIRTLPMLVYDEKRGGGEDLNTRGDDHAADSARYLLAAFRGFNRLPFGPQNDEERRYRRVPAFRRRIVW